MKKTLLPLLISGLLLVGCNDKEADKAKQSQTMASPQCEELQTQLNQQINELKAQLTEAQAKQAISAIPVEYFYLEEGVPYKRPGEKGEPDETGTTDLEYRYAGVKTNLDWLNDLLSREFLSRAITNLDSDDRSHQLNTIEDLKAELTQSFADLKKEVSEEGGLGYTIIQNQKFLGQQPGLAQFAHYNYLYTGGAHGIYGTDYLNVDLDSHKILHLADIFADKNKLKARLWEIFQMGNRDGEYDMFVKENDFEVADNFQLSPYGITFVYPVYALGPYVEGEKTIEVSWGEVETWLTPTFKQSTFYQFAKAFKPHVE